MTNEYLNNTTFEKSIHRFRKSQKNKEKYELILADIKASEDRRRKRKNVNESKNAEKDDQITKMFQTHKAANKEFLEAQSDLARQFYLLSENILRKYNFKAIDRDDALQEGVTICFEKLHRFKPCKGKAFNFCTTIILNHYRQLHRTAKVQDDLKIKFYEHQCEKNETTMMRNINGFNNASYRKRPGD